MSGPAQLSPAEMAELSQLAFQIAHNDKTREHFALLVNHVDPAKGKAFADVFMRRELAAFKQTINNERQQEKMTQIVEAQQSKRHEVIAKHKYTPDQVKKVDDICTQYGLSDYDAAARIYSTYNPPEDPSLKPPPEMMAESTWDFPTVPGPDGKMLGFKDYIQNPRKYSNNTAMQMITEFKRGRLPSAFHGS
jgi:hypothetical protein